MTLKCQGAVGWDLPFKVNLTYMNSLKTIMVEAEDDQVGVNNLHIKPCY